MKKTFIVIVIILSLIVILGTRAFNSAKNNTVVDVPEPTQETKTPVQLCFYQETKSSRNLYDVSWIKMSLSDNKVRGEFRYLPAEKDSKVGTFEGTVDEVHKESMSRTALVWWETLAEGIHNREQLQIIFGEGIAQAGFGEMVQQSEGVYIYKDASVLTYGTSMTDVSCNDLDDRILVEKYIRANIQTLAPEKPTLGGTWYITNVHIDPIQKIGIMKYEDGHIEGSALFSYTQTNNEVVLSDIIKGDETTLNTIYITSQNPWPPKVTLTKGNFVCKENVAGDGASEVKVGGITTKRMISGKEYCVRTISEGAAGSIYTTYSYVAKIEQKIAKVSFILKAVQCMNYDDPKKALCLKEREAFNPDTLADNIITRAIDI